MTKIFDIIPSWVYALALASVVLAGGAYIAFLEVRLSGAKVELAEARQQASDERAKLALAAAAYSGAITKLMAMHATDQQLLENRYAQTLTVLEARRAAAVAENGRLRGTIATYTARDRRPGETDAAALERAEDRLAVVGALLEEGVSLVIEGGGVVEGRDAEVRRLLDQIALDRQACQKAVMP